MHLRQKFLTSAACFAPADDQGSAPPASDPAAAAAPAEPPPSPPAADPAPPAPAAAPPASDWKDARIKELTAKLNAERAKQVPPPPPPAPAVGESPEAFQARVDAAATEKAAELAAINDWNRRCDAVAEQGAKEFPDFNERMAKARSVVNFNDGAEVAAFNGIVSAALETGVAHKVLHELGETPGEVTRLMRLSPLKMAMEMATRAAKIGAGPPAEEPSGAPRPIEPIDSRGLHYDGLDPRNVNGAKLPIGQWMKMREKQAEEAGIQ